MKVCDFLLALGMLNWLFMFCHIKWKILGKNKCQVTVYLGRTIEQCVSIDTVITAFQEKNAEQLVWHQHSSVFSIKASIIRILFNVLLIQGEIFGGVEQPLLPPLLTSPSASVIAVSTSQLWIKTCYMLRKGKDVMLETCFPGAFYSKTPLVAENGSWQGLGGCTAQVGSSGFPEKLWEMVLSGSWANHGVVSSLHLLPKLQAAFRRKAM